MSKLISLLALIFVGFYWAQTQKLKAIAVRAGRSRCQQLGIQFLDHTVVHDKRRLVRDDAGNWRVERQYCFEFTSTGEERYQGRVTLLGRFPTAVDLEPYSIN